MNAEEQEYMDYLIHNRTERTKQNTRLLDEIEGLEKKLAIATKALKKINRKYRFTVAQDVVYKALKEIDLVGTPGKEEG